MNKNKYPIIAALLIAFIMVVGSLIIRGFKSIGQDIKEHNSPEVEIWTREYYEQEKVNTIAQIEDLKADYEKHEQAMIEDHNKADQLRLYLNEVNKELYGTPERLKVMGKICELSPNSPMCNNWDMFMDLINVAEAKGVDYKLLLGIMYAESHIWAEFKPYHCGITNNWAWLKARKYDDGSISEWYNIQYENLQDARLEGCWLYYFEDVHTFFESLANTISIGYGKCNEDVYCISRSYVWHESGAWVNNVYKFKSL